MKLEYIYKTIPFICLLFLVACSSSSQLQKTEELVKNNTSWLDIADTIESEKIKVAYFLDQLKSISKPKKYRESNTKILLFMSKKNNHSPQLENFISSICDSGFFKRNFEIDSSVMFYRFAKPNTQGIGMVYLSDRYPYDYFDEQAALSKNFVRDFSFVFPRVYFIRENKINILSGDLDLSDRKEFCRIPTKNDTLFEKIYTYRKNNNDAILDISYRFQYVTYSNASLRWKTQIAGALTDSSVITKDLISYIDYNSLKEIMAQNNSTEIMLNVDTTSYSSTEKWFYAGTINQLNEWENNYTNIVKNEMVDGFIKDTTSYFTTNSVLYVRAKPPENYQETKISENNKKGKIIGSISPTDKIFIDKQKRVLDVKGNISLWLRIKKTEKNKVK